MSLCSAIRLIGAILLCLPGLWAGGQRTYTNSSVLAGGNWYKIAVTEQGVYKIDLAFLARLGVSTVNLSSSSIQLFGNGGQMLPEAANGTKLDDLVENAIWMEDGGDGNFNGSDYFLFYAEGPHRWFPDAANARFRHQKNIYSEQSFYYLKIGANGKRITTQTTPPLANTNINSYNARYFYELDTVNFLSSGKQWFGEEYSNLPGKSLSRNYNLSIPGLSNGSALLEARTAARSFGTGSAFSITVNSQQVLQQNIPAVASGAYDLFAQTVQSSASFITTAPSLSIQFTYSPGSFGSQGWLDWFEVHARAQLSMAGINQLPFRDWNSAGAGNIGQFTIANTASSVQVWDVSNPLEPVRMQGTQSGTEYRFTRECNVLKEFIAFTNNGFLTPVALGKINNQDLHRADFTDMLIVCAPVTLPQTNRLAQYHLQRDGLKSLVVTIKQVYNEFSSGTPDPTAIRDFAKMFYDRAGSDSSKRPKYLLLFGDASFDYKNRIRNNSNLVPAYESDNSLDPLATYTSDDYYGFLDDADDINGNATYLLDIGIGRIPAKDEAEAGNMVDKIIAYNSQQSLGAWRNELSFIADDEDNNLHLQDAEVVTNTALNTAPVFNIDKIYLDAYRQEGGSGGSRYPEVNEAINGKIFNGTLIWNYSGHGGFRRLAEEVILDQDIINGFNNPYRLPLFVTATCDVAPYDNPLVSSIGENLLLREKTGAIALMTTTRIVFAFSNRVMNDNYLRTLLKRKADSTYPSLGEAVRLAKNFTYTFFGDAINNRKFTLLGDPALKLGLPGKRVYTDSINGRAVSSIPDTLKALDSYVISGQVRDELGNPLNNFNGTVYPVVFDKPQSLQTRANDPGSSVTNFTVQKNVLFRGKAKVENGRFSFRFIVPKDINYAYGNGKISYYADNGSIDGNGLLQNIIIGGTGNGNGDIVGPTIKAWLNDEKFVDGSITNSNPILLLKLFDSSGINIMGTGIGHDLVAILDNDPENAFVLNQFYESELDDFRKGIVRYQLPLIAEGEHTLRIKAWDAVNNSSEITINFRVVKQDKLVLDHVLNYPNPFTTRTSFWFEHNFPNTEMTITVQVYTVSGKLVKTLRKTIFSTGNRSSEVEWDGRDEYGNRLGRGVYIYRLKVQTAEGKSADKWEKLYIL